MGLDDVTEFGTIQVTMVSFKNENGESAWTFAALKKHGRL